MAFKLCASGLRKTAKRFCAVLLNFENDLLSLIKGQRQYIVVFRYRDLWPLDLVLQRKLDLNYAAGSLQSVAGLVA